MTRVEEQSEAPRFHAAWLTDAKASRYIDMLDRIRRAIDHGNIVIF